MRYTLFENSGDIIAESNNKTELIKKCRKIENRATVIDDADGIIFENKAQIKINKENKAC